MARPPLRPVQVSAAVLLAAAVVVGAVTLLRPTRSPAQAVEVSGTMPTVDRHTLQGGHVDPAWYGGRIVVVNFWASWCGPCRREQPGLQRLWERYRGRGVRFLGVDYDDDRAAALAYLDEFRVTYPSVYDRDGRLTFRFGIPYLPATVLIDRAGEMRYRLVGAQTEATVRSYLEGLLAEEGPG